MANSSIYDCSIVELDRIQNRSGNITIVENGTNIPFKIKRVYYLFDIPGGESRGGHAHKKLNQFMVAASGSFDVTVDDGSSRRTLTLNRPNYALYIKPGIWRELSNFSSGAICFVLASEVYDEEDYIREYSEFVSYRKKRTI